jgi:ankyrin repeat protein
MPLLCSRLKVMIDAKADVNQQINGDSTALHMACQDGHVEDVRLLIINNRAYVQLRSYWCLKLINTIWSKCTLHRCEIRLH